MSPANRETHLSEICMLFANAYKIQFVFTLLGEISPCATGTTVKWVKIFHLKASSHLTGMDIFFDFDL
jgi:hypothetical protein